MKYAYTQNNTVAQVLRVDPANIYRPEMAKQFVECGEEVEVGWLWDGETFKAPPAPTQAEIDEADAKRLQDKIEALWQAADRYTSGYISGVAIGILTIGAMRQLPKAMAVTAWSGAIWAEYYARKEMVTATSEDNHDFSWFGPIPHSVPELRAEAGM